jgi:transcriptional regulator with XRE-family HTH domain
MSRIDLATAEIVSNNLKALMNRYDLTSLGVAEGSGLEVHTISRILSSKTNISALSAKKLADFFGITIDKIFSNSKMRFKRKENIIALKFFCESNSLNYGYFRSKEKEYVAAHFLKTVLINDKFLNEGRRVSQISKYIGDKYKKDFDPKVIAKELYRMSEANLLKREDKTGKRSVYYYSHKIMVG